MADFADRQISQLSGGQQQRVFLARALAQEARLYFMDEPFAGVDAATETRDRRRAAPAARRGPHGDRASITTCRRVPEYFDHVLLLNMRVVAAGPVARRFTTENLRQHLRRPADAARRGRGRARPRSAIGA